MSIQATRHNASLDLSGKTAVIAGGTQGIGEGVAIRFAQLGASRIFIVGRNEQSGNTVLQRLRDASAACSSSGAKQQFEFLRADLSSIKAITEAANEIKQKVGSKGVDYLVMTQGGTPNGLYDENSDGLDKSFVVQCLSRFGLSYFLAESKTLNSGSSVVSVLSPGSDFSELDIDDISLKKLHSTKPWRASFLISQGKRDSMITDALTLEFNRRYPSINFYHLFPGFVTTSVLFNRGFPFPLPQLSSLLAPILNKTIANSPSSYSDVPIFFAANPESKKFDGYFFNERLKKIEPSNKAKDPEMQQTIFQKFKGLLEYK
ncbi:hypothetical protein PPACK8108_LOCUS17241 [Phakopsora pachyrhizi]|uniref:NAD(P)-binding protein n=1 Tax=Phakopsora pachyrhizi TaxID=170000 RepID=A0AAV0BC68_PHAPC|nr:hypothetical protein PPACK8108_LOCUS17241 [Phakopsora pachyrhizi]